MKLDMFNRHPEKIAMANCAQLINCLNSLYLAHEDSSSSPRRARVFKLVRAPTQGGDSLRTIFSAPQAAYDRDGKPAKVWSLNGSASLKGKDLHLTVVNFHVSQSRKTEIIVRGASASSATASVLTHTDLHAYNSFDHRDVVLPQSTPVTLRDGAIIHHTFPPASVTALTIHLA